MRDKNRNLQNQAFADNLIKQIQFKEAYFAFKENKYKQWKLSPSGKIEKIWQKSQIKKYPIKDLEIQEIYKTGLANSHYYNLRKFLFNNMTSKFVKTTLTRVQYFNSCLTNIWYEKYFRKFEKIKENLIEIASDPEILFYPCYLKFLTVTRESIIKNMTNLIIPSVVAFSLMDAKNQINVTDEIKRAKNTIKIGFSSVKADCEAAFEDLNQKITKLYLTNNNSAISKEVTQVFIEEIQVKQVFQKEFDKFQFEKACKLLKISGRMKLENAFLKYQIRLSKAEVSDILRGDEKETADLKKAWQIYIKYRNENAN